MCILQNITPHDAFEAVTSIGTLAAAAATFLTVREMDPTEFHWIEAPKDESQKNTKPFSLTIVNVGLGAAKYLKATWNIDYERLSTLGEQFNLKKKFKFEGGKFGILKVGERRFYHTQVGSNESYDICRISKTKEDGLVIRIPLALQDFATTAILSLIDNPDNKNLAHEIETLFGASLEITYFDTLENQFKKKFNFSFSLQMFSKESFQANINVNFMKTK